MEESAPRFVEYFPGWQLEQKDPSLASLDESPTVEENFPALQLTHAEDLSALEYFPALHCSQLTYSAPTTVENVPAEHPIHAENCLYIPAGHFQEHES